jgi:hypothetical protein
MGHNGLFKKIIQKKIYFVGLRKRVKREAMNTCLFNKSKEFYGFPPVMILEDFCGQMPVVTSPPFLHPLVLVFGLRWFCSVAFPFKTLSLSFI